MVFTMGDKLLKNYLKHLHREYAKKHGSALSKLQEHKFPILDAALCYEVPGMVEVSSDGDIRRNAVDIVTELKERGWVDTDTYRFWLTPLGIQEAKISWLDSSFSYINANPWIAILISLVSVIIALYSLFVN